MVESGKGKRWGAARARPAKRARYWVLAPAEAAGSDTEFIVLRRPKMQTPPPPVVPDAPAQPEIASSPLVVVGPVLGVPATNPPPLSVYRAESYRVYSVVLTLVAAVCATLVVTVGLVVLAVLSNGPQEAPVVRIIPDFPAVQDEDLVDTGPFRGADLAAPAPTPAPTLEAEPVDAVDSVGGTPPEVVASVRAPGQAGAVTVEIPAGLYVSSFEVSCPSVEGFRHRGFFQGNRAVVPDVPVANCTGRFKGGGISSKVIIRDGAVDLTCSALNPSTLICR